MLAPKQSITGQDYPFANVGPRCQGVQTVVQQTLRVSPQERNHIIAKANFVKYLKSRRIVKILNVLNQGQDIHLIYEYVQTRFIDVVKSLDREKLYNVCNELWQLGNDLAMIGVSSRIRAEGLGWGADGKVKYFLGVDFQWEEELELEQLQDQYRSQVDQIINTLVLNNRNAKQTGINCTAKEEKNRKVSMATLYNNRNLLMRDSDRLTEVSSIAPFKSLEHQGRKQSNAATIVRANKFKGPKMCKSFISDDGDIDYQAQIGSAHLQVGKTEKNYEARREQTKKSTNKIYDFRVKDEYVQDFMTVFDDVSNCSAQRYTPRTQQSPQRDHFRRVDSTSIMLSAEQPSLQEMAEQSIKNSEKVIYRFRTLLRG